MTYLNQPALHDLIEAAYVLFAPYTLGATLSVCKVCCVNDAQEQAFYARRCARSPGRC